MDYWVLRPLKGRLSSDLIEYLPEEGFTQSTNISKDKSAPEYELQLNWGTWAWGSGKNIFYDYCLPITPRQACAADVLMKLGLLEATRGKLLEIDFILNGTDTSNEEMREKARRHKPQLLAAIPQLEENVFCALPNYLLFLEANESELFKQLLVVTSCLEDANNKNSIKENAEVSEDELADLFDDVGKQQLEKMFPDSGQWDAYADKASKNGLADAARRGRNKFNPYLAAHWWLTKKRPKNWDWARCERALASNLPPRSKGMEAVIAGDMY